MRMLEFEPFLRDFGNAGRLTMNMSIYRDNYQCACGKAHWFDEYANIVCQGFYKVMIVCPEDPAYVTTVKIKTVLGFAFKGFESLAGTRMRNDGELLALRTIRLTVR